jgi:hypothetical protein
MRFGRKRSIFALLTVAILLCVFVSIFHNTLNLFNHIMPSAGVARSSSMLPYEIVLRTKVWDEEAKKLSDQFVEWKLAVPRAYLIDEDGDNGAVRQGARMELGNYHSALELLVDSGDNSVSPTIELKPSPYDDNTIQIGLINQGASPEVTDGDVCRKTAAFCHSKSKRCGIEMQIDGWIVGAAATLGLYGQPEKVCLIVKKFLNAYTTKRENLLPTR